jgi:hypothetical protein
MEQTAMKMVDETTEVENKAMQLPEKARLIVVTDNDSMAWADRTKQDITLMLKEIDGVFSPLAKRAHEAHKAITTKVAEIKAPLLEANEYLVSQVKGYLRKVKEAEDAERRRFEEIARKEAEERALTEAEALEKEGAFEEAQQIINEPVYVAPVVVERQTPKVDNRTYRTVWKARLVDKMALIKFVAQNPNFSHLLDVNQSQLNQLAKNQQRTMRIPGVVAEEA